MLSALCASVGLAAAENGSLPIQQTGTIEAVIPADLQPLLLENAQARFLVTVNEEGQLVDYLPVEATHHALLPRAVETLRQVVFAPALKDGKPVQGTAEVTVFFFDPEQRAIRSGMISRPFGVTPSEGAERRIYEGSKGRLAYRRATAAELDRPLETRESKIVVLTDAEGRPAVGECLVDYYIDAQGEVRMPRVLKADNDTVALSALMTLQKTRYGPVTRDGIPAYVKVRQPMSYAVVEKAAEAK
jgi:hypothetical protein